MQRPIEFVLIVCLACSLVYVATNKSHQEPVPVQQKANWMVILHNSVGDPMRCWRLTSTTVEVSNGTTSFTDPDTSAHISLTGQVISARVPEGQWDRVALDLGLPTEACGAIHGQSYHPEHGYRPRNFD